MTFEFTFLVYQPQREIAKWHNEHLNDLTIVRASTSHESQWTKLTVVIQEPEDWNMLPNLQCPGFKTVDHLCSFVHNIQAKEV